MIALIRFVLAVLASPFKSKSRLEAENAVLRHQLIVLRRKLKGRARLTNNDRWFFVWMYRWFPTILEGVTIVQPETLVRWHRVGFRSYWRWKSSSRGGRPQIETELRALIRRMSTENQHDAAHPANFRSSLGLASRNQRSPRTRGQAPRAGQPGMAADLSAGKTTRRTLPPWTCSLFQPSVSICSMPPALCLRHRPARPQRPRLDQRHSKSHSRMGCASNNGGISLG